MANLLEKMTTEYGEKIVISEKNREKYAGFSNLTGEEKALYELLERYGAGNIHISLEKEPSTEAVFHFSDQRSNLVAWLPIDKNAKVLEIGAECGAVTSYLVKKAALVDAVEPSLEQCAINLKRNSAAENLKVYSCGLDELESFISKEYDYIFVYNCHEKGFNRAGMAEMLEKLNHHLTANGRLAVATDNRLGLKFFSGSKPERRASYFEGITGFVGSEAETAYSREALENIFLHAGIKEYNFFYPYPDFKLMSTLYSDERLPKVGELTDNRKNFEGDRMSLFDEKSSFDSVITDGCFDRFANSFLVVTGKTFDTVYAKFSAERDRATALLTTIEKNEKDYVIKKQALFNEGTQHIANMAENYISLCKKYSGCDLQINKCLGIEAAGTTAVFEYVPGITLSEVLDDCLKRGDANSFRKHLNRYMAYLQENSEVAPFNRDVIFDNILVKDDNWTLIDYEWCDKNPIKYQEIAFRSLHTYLVSDKRRNIFNYDLIFETLGITPAEGEEINKKEFAFQQKVKGSAVSLADINHKMGKELYEPVKNGSDEGFRFQVYRCDANGGFSEADSFFLNNVYGMNNSARFSIEVTEADKVLRFDPVMRPCIVKLTDLTLNGTDIPVNKKNVLSNGKFVKPDTFIFNTSDPNIVLNLKNLGVCKGTLNAEMKIYPLPGEVIGNIAEHISIF